MKRRIFGMILLVVLMTVVAACGNNADPSNEGSAENNTLSTDQGTNSSTGDSSEEAASEDTPPEEVSVDGITLRIARQDGPSASLLFVADAMGYISETGLDYEISDPSSAFESLLAKEIDVAFGAPDTFSIYEENSGLIGLTGISSQPNDVKLVVESDINDPSDFKGKSIGIVPGTVSQYIMENVFFKEAGMEVGVDYESVATDPAQLIPLLARGDISGFLLWEPFPSNAVESMNGESKILMNSGELGFPNAIVMVVNGSDLEDPALKLAYQKLIEAFVKAENYIKDDPEGAAEIIADATEQSVEAIMTAIETNRYEVFMDHTIYNEISKYNMILQETGVTTYEVDPQEVINTELLEAIGVPVE